jgi:hypothetical protein
MGFAHPACIPHLKVEGLCGAFLNASLNLPHTGSNEQESVAKFAGKRSLERRNQRKLTARI